MPQQLRTNRDLFTLPDGSYYTWKGNIDFMAYFRSLDGADMSFLNQRIACGSKSITTLFMAKFIEDKDPDRYGQRMFDHIKPFARFLNDLDLYWNPIIFADQQVFGWSIEKQRDFLNKCAAQFDGEANVMPSLGNEYQKNGFDPSRFAKPNTSNLWSRGSSVGDTEPYYPGWDYKEWHPRRDMPQVLTACGDGWYVANGIDAGGKILDRPMPCIAGEPIGFWDRDIPNRRSQDPNLAYCVASNSVACLRGANFMSEEGLKCQTWTPRTEVCAKRFFETLNQFYIQ